ncbi:ArsR family (ArsR) [Fructobacillus fructosus]|uniref:ArsR/SmtB family transcription factor n=1 Tax=Fructobacillus fructosus TaxID=1631 RepID=UPI00021955C8|nr:helix-turn-helix domain-containing protein [Fructobacillus fructosus]KRN52917.1 hypothetical protein IV71_GL000812 [Fructobacillus fructosus KCTC 3544]GAP00983.1 transcriptional regulator, ArsR family [Fructobacillus fructosus]CAK1248796.1 ArsR family (ArsR) [Fructobacillus fructosus]
MDINEQIFKALANDSRLKILKWLRRPEVFATDEVPVANINYMVENYGGVCATLIVAKTKLAQSTVSAYLKQLVQVDLLISERHDKWTYYRRNEKQIDCLVKYLEE